MPLRFLVVAMIGASLFCFGAAQAPLYESPEEELPRSVAPQPIPFDHSLHMRNRMACADCHPGAADRERAGLPGRDDCMLCHQTISVESEAVRGLAAMPVGEAIEWVRVYQVPGFAFFSHRDHVPNGVGCEQCHGPVGERSVLSQELSVNMVSCMNCHAERDVSNECYLCHDLGQ